MQKWIGEETVFFRIVGFLGRIIKNHISAEGGNHHSAFLHSAFCIVFGLR